MSFAHLLAPFSVSVLLAQFAYADDQGDSPIMDDGSYAGGKSSIGIVAQISSDWVYHGASETLGEPVVGVNLEWQASSHLFLGIEAHRAQRDEGELQRQKSVMLYAGLGGELGEKWYGTASITHRHFSESAKGWDFSELQIDVNHPGGWSLSLDYSPDYYDHGTAAFASELSYHRQFTRHVYGLAMLGAIEFSQRRFSDYRYAQLGTGFSWSQFNIDISYGWNSALGRTEFGREALESPEIVAQLSYRLR